MHTARVLLGGLGGVLLGEAEASKHAVCLVPDSILRYTLELAVEEQVVPPLEEREEGVLNGGGVFRNRKRGA